MTRFRHILAAAATCFAVAAAPRAPQQITPGTPPGAQSAAVAPISLSDADGQELILEELSARTAIQGMLSLTELELRFRNPKARRIEGRFTCTLPPNAAISRFAKEVGGQLMEGEVVERLRANQVYEQFLHQMRDPALLEQDQGNRFSARIFPIDPNASVRLVLSYTALLPAEGGVRRYTLPMRGMAAIKHFTFRAFVTALPGEEGPGAAKSDVAGLAGATRSTADVISLDESDYTPSNDIELTWRPTAAAARARLLKAGDFYVAAFRPQVAQAETQTTPHTWAFYVDTSASAAEGAEHRIRALETLLASMPPDDAVQIFAFDQEIVSVGVGSAAELSRSIGASLRAHLFLGGTDLGALFRHIARYTNDRRVVVASDLVPTLGDTDKHELTEIIRTIPPGRVVHALILGSRQDAAMAKALTAGHGRVVTIPFTDALDERARAAADALRRPLGASFDVSDSAAEWVYPSHVDDVQSGDEVIVLGRLKAGSDSSLQLNGKKTDVSAQSLSTAAFAPLLEREGYRAYLDYLAEREANEPSAAVREALATEQVKISVERRVVTPRTTMLVLESEWDYQRFGLDRRALASILTIDAGGIGVIERKNASLAIPVTVPPPRPVTKSRAALQPTQAPAPVPPAAIDGFVAGGAVAESITVSASAPAVPAGMSEQIMVTAEAPMIDTNSAASVTTSRPEPMAAPPAQIARRTRDEEVKKSDIGWIKTSQPGAKEVEALWRKLDADPRDRGVYNTLSDALAARAEWEPLRRLALQWQPYDPENPQVYEILGIADEQLHKPDEAARAEASIIEVSPAKPELLQRAGLLLLRTHRAQLAETPLRRALELRPDRVNSYRHLALMLWREGRFDEAARVLESATRQQFPQWYGDAQRVLREELGYVYRGWLAHEPARREEIARRARDFNVDLARRDALRVTLAWETDANDVDLHVVDPRGEECFYAHKSTATGLELYQDITQGLGPEVIRTEKLTKGTYHIGVNYFAAGPMGISRGIVVVMHDDDVDIYPFRLIEGGTREMRYVASVEVR